MPIINRRNAACLIKYLHRESIQKNDALTVISWRYEAAHDDRI